MVLKYLQYIFESYGEVKLFYILALKNTNSFLHFLLMRMLQMAPGSMEARVEFLTSR